jgi:signal transduction histidine kinase
VGRDRVDRLGLAAGLLAWAAVALPGLTGAPGFSPPWPWWVAYVLNGALFAATAHPRMTAGARLARPLLTAQLAAGAVVFLLDPAYGFSGVLLVLNAVTAAYLLPLWSVWLIIAGHTALVALATRELTDAGPSALTIAASYGGLQVFGVLMVETSERESRARQRLAELNAELVAAHALLADSSRTAERLRIARDLHDLVGHELTALTVNLEVASHLADGPAAESVDRSRTIARNLLTSVREVVSRLRQTPADLAAALQAVSDGVPRPTVHLQVDDGATIDDPRHSETLLRCVQEVVTNAVKHADADNLWIEVARVDSATVLRAHDDGRGTAELQPGNGLRGMRERIAECGGEVAFWTREGEGFRLVARLPAT